MDQVPNIKNIGDIIRVRRFNVNLGTKGEIFLTDVSFSNWLVYEGQGESENAYCHKDFPKNKQRIMTDFEADRVEGMRKWINKFFTEHSLKNILWWTEFKTEIV